VDIPFKETFSVPSDDTTSFNVHRLLLLEVSDLQKCKNNYQNFENIFLLFCVKKQVLIDAYIYMILKNSATESKPVVITSRLLGRFAPIFYFKSEHFLFACIVIQKIFRGFYKKNRGFSKFLIIEFC